MVERDIVSHEKLVERFRRAVDWYCMDARASYLPRYVQYLNRVERVSSLLETSPIGMLL